MRARHDTGHAAVMYDMESRISLTLIAAVVLWVVAVGLICAQAWMDMDVGLIGVGFGLAASVATVRYYFVMTARPTSDS